eukprot:scaffold104956_cov28-Tisochrysis_lutea.AAC.11
MLLLYLPLSHQVLRLADACMADTRLSVEEQQLWEAIENVGREDNHPEAHAARLKVKSACATHARSHGHAFGWKNPLAIHSALYTSYCCQRGPLAPHTTMTA